MRAALPVVVATAAKFKLLLSTASAFIAVAAYSLTFGWQFAAGVVALLFAHEMGHVIQLRREGIHASPPVFIPFLGAMIAARSLGEDALAEARIGLAGPVLGTGATLVVGVLAVLTGSHLLLALAYSGFAINLFNLLPVVPLDGGRAMAAVAPWMWSVTLAALIVVALIERIPILVMIVLLAALELRARRRSHRAQVPAYYTIPRRSRLLVTGTYLALLAVLGVGMSATYVAAASGTQ